MSLGVSGVSTLNKQLLGHTDTHTCAWDTYVHAWDHASMSRPALALVALVTVSDWMDVRIQCPFGHT